MAISWRHRDDASSSWDVLVIPAPITKVCTIPKHERRMVAVA